jgi:tRNA nucleotidyltransferase (CCA-adding enzyme)
MAIPLTQLKTWSNLPDPGRSAETYNSIKNALAASTSLYKYTYDVYLQGSYANSTNIRADSDVDVVVELTSVFRKRRI